VTGRRSRASGYKKPAGRNGGFGTPVRGGLDFDAIWNDTQRAALLECRRAQEIINAHDATREVLVDDLAVTLFRLKVAGVKQSQVARIFRLTPVTVSTLWVRAEAVLAERELANAEK
jgi:hypothetical protein